jgi:hypothetical protein
MQSGEKMKKLLVVLALLLIWVAKSPAQEKVPLRLSQTVSLRGIRHWDHFGADLKSNRLFVTSGNEAVVDVFDMRTNKLIHTITGLKGPHNVLAFPEFNEIVVVDGGASELKMFKYDTLELVGITSNSGYSSDSH